MKDSHYIALFAGLGVLLAWTVSGPLRRPPQSMPRVGTPLESMQDMTRQIPGGQTRQIELTSGGSTVATSKPSSSSKLYAEGIISLGSDLKPDDVAGRSLFIIVKARQKDGGQALAGPPLAVMRIPNPAFPNMFNLSTDNNMMGTEFYAGDIVVIARLDKDGVAGPKQADDFETSVPVSSKDSRKVNLTITR